MIWEIVRMGNNWLTGGNIKKKQEMMLLLEDRSKRKAEFSIIKRPEYEDQDFAVTINDPKPLVTISIHHIKSRPSSIQAIVSEKDCIEICDIYCTKNCRGYGTIMLKELISYAKKKDFKYIKGWISDVDRGHLDRLKHFYEKFGFEIDYVEDGNKIADLNLIL